MKKRAIYPGSFDPFTNGHLDIVKKSSELFEEVFILLGTNPQKKRSFACEGMKSAIEKTLDSCGITNCKVFIYDGLVAKFAKDNNIHYMIRGLRNNLDYNYEENIAEVNKLINPEMEYIYFRADNVAVSSSMVRELNYYGQDVSEYVSKYVLEYITNNK